MHLRDLVPVMVLGSPGDIGSFQYLSAVGAFLEEVGDTETFENSFCLHKMVDFRGLIALEFISALED